MLSDVIVVGAGIVGAACAMELSRAGFRVTICESEIVGGGATAAGMGHLAVMDDSDAQFALTSYSQQLWRELAPELPSDAEYLPCGSLWIAADDEEMAAVRRKAVYYGDRAIPIEMLDAQQLADAEPHLRPGMTGGLILKADSVCYPPCAAKYLVDEALRLGGKLMLGAEVCEIQERGVRFRDGGCLQASSVILATGTAATRFFPALALAPRKGHLLITDRYPGFIRHQLIELGYLKSAHATTEDSVAFNAQPRTTGQILIGSSRQFGTSDPKIESNMLSRMIERAIHYLPALESFSAIRTWTGFRAATPDKLPLIGKAPGFQTVYLATGHEGLGISTSLATGRLLTDELSGRASQIPREPYAASRSFRHAHA